MTDDLAAAVERLSALADAYDPGMYALCDGVYHVYANVPECCQTLQRDLRAGISALIALANPQTITQLCDSYEALVGALEPLLHECEAEFTVDGMWSSQGQMIQHRTYHRAAKALKAARAALIRDE